MKVLSSAGMRASLEREYPDSEVGQFASFDDPVDLSAHDRRAANPPVQDRLVHDGFNPGRRRLRPGQDRLPDQPDLDSLLNHRWAELRHGLLMDDARVVRYLKQPRKHSRFIITDPRGRSFQTHKSLIGQAVRLPPRLRPAFFGQPSQVLTLSGIYLVQIAQVANVPRAGAAMAGLQPGHLRRRAKQALCHLLDGHPGLGTQSAQHRP